jgi:hypothetical protein
MRTELNKPLVNSLLLIVLAIGISFANAQDSKGSVMINGLGQRACSKMTSDISEYPVSTDVYSAYIDGFATAINVTVQGKSNFLEGTDKTSRYMFVLEHCQNNPLDTLFQAINQLYLKEAGRPINELSAPPTPPPCKPLATITKPLVKETKSTVKLKKSAVKGKKSSVKSKESVVSSKKKVKKK